MQPIFHALLLLLALPPCLHCVIVFQEPDVFGTLQVQLSTSSGYISQATAKTFSVANPGYSNISTMGMALCGWDIPDPSLMQFKAEVGYDEGENSFTVLVLPLSPIKFIYLSYFLMVSSADALPFLYIDNNCLTPAFDPFNTSTSQTINYQLSSPYGINLANTYTPLPYLRSLIATLETTHVSLNITQVAYDPATGTVTLTVVSRDSFIQEICLSTIYYVENLGLRENLLNISYSPLPITVDSEDPDRNLLARATNNFSMSSIYGPEFGRKCVVGLSSLTLQANKRQTVGFNLTGEGVYGLSSSRDFVVGLGWFCAAKVTCSNADMQYYPLINDCEAACAITNCSACSTSTSCGECDPGFFINALYRCDPCTSNCLNCTRAGECLGCTDGYYTNTTNCLPCPIFCQRCQAGQCQLCETTYFVSAGNCLKCSSFLPNCHLCSASNYCQQCNAGTYFINSALGCGSCEGAMSGCEQCSTGSVCTTCMAGYYKQFTSCNRCSYDIEECCPNFVANCSQCRNATHCQQCQGGYYLSASGQTCDQCTTQLSHCQACSDSSTCILCEVGFFLNALNICEACGLYLHQCGVCTNATYCLTCVEPFLSVEGVCLDCPTWPTNSLYYLDSSNVCQPCSSVTPSCTLCAGQSECLQCDNLHYLASATSCRDCGLPMAHCLSCKNATSCSVCDNGHYVNVRNTSQCVECASSIADCVACVQMLDAATNSSELLCTICDSAFFVNNTVCSPCIEAIPYCLSCLNNYQCRECQSGYYISGTLKCITCAQLIPGCLNCLSTSVCDSCDAGFYVVNDYCTPCSMALPNCHGCAPINTVLTCSSCLPGYHLGLDFVCEPCASTLQFCQQCTSASVCVGCISGYTLNALQACVPCNELIPSCEYCSASECLKCQQNYLLSSAGQCSGCSVFVAGCEVCSQATSSISNTTQMNCSLCLGTYLAYLDSNGFSQCIACEVSLPNCLSCTNLTTCTLCNSITFANQQGSCSLCSLFLANCSTCNSSSACLQCQQGFYLNSSSLCQQCLPSQLGTTSSGASICTDCQWQGSTAVCLSCIQGYYASSNTCLACDQSMANCRSCASAFICLTCSSGHYLSPTNSHCLACDPVLTHCATCDSTGLCLACQPDYYLNSTLNQCTLCSLSTPGCFSCDSNATCLTCQDGYYSSGVACLSCAQAINQCLVCSNATNCLLSQASSTSKEESFLGRVDSTVWMALALALLLAILTILLVCLICYCCCGGGKEEGKSDDTATMKSATQRDLLPEMSLANHTEVEIKNERPCQVCKSSPFDIMQVELLCKECEGRGGRGEKHKIRKEKAADSKSKPTKKQKHKSNSSPSDPKSSVQSEEMLPQSSPYKSAVSPRAEREGGPRPSEQKAGGRVNYSRPERHSKMSA